jgi:hypothetical protein
MTTITMMGVVIQQDIDMTYGPIERFAHAAGLHTGHIKKKKKKKPEPVKSGEGSAFRDYRGVDGAVEDAEKGKK